MVVGKLIGIVLVLLLLGVPADARDEPLPTPGELAERVLARAKQVEPLWTQFEYRRVSVLKELGEDGTVKEETEELYLMVPRDGLVFSRLLEKNGVASTAKDLRRGEERHQRALKRREERQRTGRASSEDRELSKEILERFDFKIEGRERLNGRNTLKIALAPKANPPRERSQTDKVLNRLRGHVWVDEALYDLVRADVHLTQPVRFYAILGVARKLTVLYEAQLVDGQVWFPARFEMAIDARRLVSQVRTHQTERFFDFKRHDAAAGTAQR
jgi:hypothetical protein